MRRLRYLSAGARALGTASVLTTIWLAPSGCGPVEYLNQVSSKAGTAVAAAKAANAEQYAPYEYTAALAYLHKAREEGAYAEYQSAIEYGRRSQELATRALAIASEQGKAGKVGKVDMNGATPRSLRAEPPARAKDSP